MNFVPSLFARGVVDALSEYALHEMLKLTGSFYKHAFRAKSSRTALQICLNGKNLVEKQILYLHKKGETTVSRDLRELAVLVNCWSAHPDEETKKLIRNLQSKVFDFRMVITQNDLPSDFLKLALTWMIRTLDITLPPRAPIVDFLFSLAAKKQLYRIHVKHPCETSQCSKLNEIYMMLLQQDQFQVLETRHFSIPIYEYWLRNPYVFRGKKLQYMNWTNSNASNYSKEFVRTNEFRFTDKNAYLREYTLAHSDGVSKMLMYGYSEMRLQSAKDNLFASLCNVKEVVFM
ncbi:hypothetical protein QR680_014282 [Steinernema hermaphroditum]|uniref:Uncharacterized protein n=1 Tax=Steinernema hermaphroditum TaxID=289476 RepID=A0AA39IAN4_9BILA|nr:hypothetical protein QR680_014282 [Steinernema hermaphroditum]